MQLAEKRLKTSNVGGRRSPFISGKASSSERHTYTVLMAFSQLAEAFTYYHPMICEMALNWPEGASRSILVSVAVLVGRSDSKSLSKLSAQAASK